jgi:hypothetical protein
VQGVIAAATYTDGAVRYHKAETVSADSGYFSKEAVKEKAGWPVKRMEGKKLYNVRSAAESNRRPAAVLRPL